jgi:signal transduction histidine kinase
MVEVENSKRNIEELLGEIDALKSQLFDANNIIDAIKEGSVDALVLHDQGTPQVYSLESADYTYRILIEKFSEGALSISSNGLILYCNDYFARLINVPANHIVGSYLSLYIDEVLLKTFIDETMAAGSSRGEIILNSNSSRLPAYMSFTNLQPNTDAIGVIVTDLTEKKQHEESLLQYQRQLEIKVNELNTTNTNLGQFIHVISHDLKEPLRKMLMYTSRLDTYGTPTESNALSVIKSSAQRLNSLVDDLVKYAFISVKEDAGKISLADVLHEVLDDLELIIAENNAVITMQPLPVICANKVQMRQLFSNLLSNAIKYSRDGVAPKIRITYTLTENEPKFYKISIQDNGIGMDPAYLTKIFTIFQRLHMPSQYSGNGIGLAICKKIMENHSGSIEVESTLNEGSTFNLYFPVTA